MRIGVIGLWHLGEVVLAGLATLGHEVIGFDTDQTVVMNLRQGILPLDEPRIKEVVDEYRKKGTLHFSSEFSDISGCDALFLTIDTPVDHEDRPDTSSLFTICEGMSSFVRDDALFVVMSQVPVGTTKALYETIQRGQPSFSGGYIYFPENLQLGNALACFLEPARLVIGADDEKSLESFHRIFPKKETLQFIMSLASSEMSKHALNAFLATSLSFTYNISDLCEATGADVGDVMKALKSDPRISPAAYLDTSVGFSGGTLMRDLRALSSLATEKKKSIPVIEAVLETNLRRRSVFVDRVGELLGFSLTEAVCGIYGVTYKVGTPTLRRSLGVELLQLFKNCGAMVKACNPPVDEKEFEALTGISLISDPYELAKGCHAVILVTPWPVFLSLDFSRIKERMEPPYLFVDTRNVLKDKEADIRRAGIQYVGIGRI